MNQYATEGLLPDVTILIDLDPVEGLARIKNNNREVDRLDLEKINFHNLVREGYLAVAKKFPNRIKVIDGSSCMNKVYNDVKEAVLKLL